MTEKIKYENGKIETPDNPVILFVEGDGTGPDIWRASKIVIDEAVEIAKIFSTKDSGKFVNGILDKIKTERQTA